MASTYRYYQDPCALCGKEFPKRDLNKLLMARSHSSVPQARQLCGVCDNCLQKLLDFLEVPSKQNKEI